MAAIDLIRHCIIQQRLGGRVERCHGIPHAGSYSNAMHQWGVAMLMWNLWPNDFPRLALDCLSHDVPEGWTGDIPAPTNKYAGISARMKRMEGWINQTLGLPNENELPPDDYAKLKACDALELYLWSIEELLKGNRYAGECKRELEIYFAAAPLPQPAQELYLNLADLYLNHQQSLIPIQSGVVRDAAQATEK